MKKRDDSDKYVKWFSSLSYKDVQLVGGKAANLGEMYNLGLPIPQGFAITSYAYSYFLESTGIKDKIYEILNSINIENTKELDKASEKIKEIIEGSEIPADMREEILEAYNSLSVNPDLLSKATTNVLQILKLQDPSFVAVRSSATAEDSSAASFAGQQETFLNIKGKENLIQSIKKCFASLFTPRSIYYRVKKNFKHEDVLIAVVVQLMINATKSGVIFSKNPLDNSEDIIIEAVFGLGEGIVSGKIEPDHYVVSRDLELKNKRVGNKKIAIVRNSAGETGQVKLTEERSNSQVLTEYESKKLADYAIKLEEHYKKPQDIEFAVDSEIYIVQTRPITTISENKKQEVQGKEILSGQAASPGIGVGEVRIIKDIKDLENVKRGDVLVTEMTNPDMVVAMQKSSAILTDEGGMTSHAAIVSREMGIPAVVGAKIATKLLKNGMIITVNGYDGRIYEGKSEEKKVEILPIVETKTKIKVIVDLPDYAERAAKSGCKDVGLVRLEGIIAESGKHPNYFLKNNTLEDYEDIIYKGIKKIAEYFQELWVRTSDIRTDEYKNLEQAPEKTELNPMLGMHGIRASLKKPRILEAEIKALARIEGKVGIMMPQIISIEEVRAVKKIISDLNLNEKLKLGVMIETPAAVQIIEELCKEGIKFISFGTNDLTQYTLAIDRNNEEVQYLYDELHPAILRQISQVIETCKKYNVETSICGQAAGKKEMAEFLVKEGISSLSVNADKAREISLLVQGIENKNISNKKMNKTTCSDCKKETEVPFVPDGIRPVFCKECLSKKKEEKKKEYEASKEKPKENKEFYKEEAKEIIESLNIFS